jgi:transketolase
MAETGWQELFAAYGSQEPKLHAELSRRLRGELPQDWQKALLTYETADPAIASRKLSESILSVIQSALPDLMSGSADFTPSNLTRWKNATDFQANEMGLGRWEGRYLR